MVSSTKSEFGMYLNCYVVFPKTTIKIVPGPGAHENKEALSSTGKYFLSKNKCSKSKIFNPRSSSRFHRSTTDAPGSGTYHPKNDMPTDGNYV